MPQIEIDDNSLGILKNTKEVMITEGIRASYSDAIRRLKDGSKE